MPHLVANVKLRGVGKLRLKYNQTFGTLHAWTRRAERLKACSPARSFSLPSICIFISSCMYPSTQCESVCVYVCKCVYTNYGAQPTANGRRNSRPPMTSDFHQCYVKSSLGCKSLRL